LTKKKKKDKHSLDIGGQELVRDDKNSLLIRKVDGTKFRFAFYGTDRHLEKEHKSILDNYYSRNLLDIYNREHNSKRYWAGQRYEQKFESAGIRQKLTSSLKENLGNSTKEEFLVQNFDAKSEFRFIDKEMGKFSNILWYVIIEGNPAKKRINEFRESLDKLIELFDM
jgi:hypothetical protein